MNTLDHITTLTRSRSDVVDAGVIHRVENMSDHEPVYAVIEVKNEAASNHEIPKVEVKPKPSWKDATSDQKLEFNDVLFRKLFNMNIPSEVVECTNIHCENNEHKDKIDSYIGELLQFVNDSGIETLPVPQPSKKKEDQRTKCTAGLKEYVEPFQDKARFWFSVWTSAGKPQNTELHRIMKASRNKFHYQVRQCKRVENFIQRQKNNRKLF